MKKALLLVLLAAAPALACKRDATCDEAASHAHILLHKEHPTIATDEAEAARAATAKRCRDQAWPGAARNCVMLAKTLDAAAKCVPGGSP
jgi:hypothetical protein